MKTSDNLQQNAFYRINGLPSDGDAVLLGRLRDEKLLFGMDDKEAEELQHALLQPDSRLRAEIGFFPGEPGERVRQLRSWLESAGPVPEGGAKPPRQLPDAGIGIDEKTEASGLSELNAAAAFLGSWPVSDGGSAAAAFESILTAAKGIDMQALMAEINQDRMASGHAAQKDEADVITAVTEHAQDLLRGLVERCKALSPGEYREAIDLLTDRFCSSGSVLHRDSLTEWTVLRLADAGMIAASAAQERERMEERIRFYSELPRGSVGMGWRQGGMQDALDPGQDIIDFVVHMERWGELTAPERRIQREKGFMEQSAHELQKLLDSFLVSLFNEHKAYAKAAAIAETMREVFFDMEESDRDWTEDVYKRAVRMAYAGAIGKP